MTDIDVTAIEARADGATWAPWQVTDGGVVSGDDWICYSTEHVDGTLAGNAQAAANDRFIAAARTDVPDLLAALKASRAREAALAAKVARVHALLDDWHEHQYEDHEDLTFYAIRVALADETTTQATKRNHRAQPPTEGDS